MFARLVSVFLLVLFSGPTTGWAQTLAEADGPAEAPPASFTGSQYVDSKGCVFVRAGYGNRVVWVPRVSRDRKLLCGQTPTFSRISTPVAPVQTVRPVTVRAAARTQQAPAAVSEQRLVAGDVLGVPQGFRPAWSDGRLNPFRGPRTSEGDAQMAKVWTNTVPRKLAQPIQAPKAARVASSPRQGTVVWSSRGRPVEGTGSAFIQLGTYGQPNNAVAVLAWLDRAGMAGIVRAGQLNGNPVRTVLAGPFSSDQTMNNALARIHSAGYSDAFIRR